MDVSSRTAQLCIAGTKAEFERRIDDARALYRSAWEAAAGDRDAAMAAHYMGHLELEPHEALRWHQVALEHAERDEECEPFLGSLLVTLGGAYEALGQQAEAERFFERAAARGVEHHRAAPAQGDVSCG